MKVSPNTLFFIVFVVVVLPASYFYFNAIEERHKNILSFEDCARAGFKVLPTYPETCKIPGKTFSNPQQKKEPTKEALTLQRQEDIKALYKNNSYVIEGQRIKLEDGVGTITTAMSLEKTTSTVEASGGFAPFDINQDTKDDALFLLKVKPMLSKKYAYYITALVSLYNGYTGINALYLGNEIASTTIVYKNNYIIITYQDTNSTPILRKQKFFIFNNDILQEVPQP